MCRTCDVCDLLQDDVPSFDGTVDGTFDGTSSQVQAVTTKMLPVAVAQNAPQDDVLLRARQYVERLSQLEQALCQKGCIHLPEREKE